LAPMQELLAPHAELAPQALVPLHFALVHTEPEEVQSVSMEQAEAAPQVAPAPQVAFEVHACPIFVPLEHVREQVPLVAPHTPLSQSACL